MLTVLLVLCFDDHETLVNAKERADHVEYLDGDLSRNDESDWNAFEEVKNLPWVPNRGRAEIKGSCVNLAKEHTNVLVSLKSIKLTMVSGLTS